MSQYTKICKLNVTEYQKQNKEIISNFLFNIDSLIKSTKNLIISHSKNETDLQQKLKPIQDICSIYTLYQLPLNIANAVYKWKFEESINKDIDIVVLGIDDDMVVTLLSNLGFNQKSNTLEKYKVTLIKGSRKHRFELTKI